MSRYLGQSVQPCIFLTVFSIKVTSRVDVVNPGCFVKCVGDYDSACVRCTALCVDVEECDVAIGFFHYLMSIVFLHCSGD